jgi:hypothetical protein
MKKLGAESEENSEQIRVQLFFAFAFFPKESGATRASGSDAILNMYVMT